VTAPAAPIVYLVDDDPSFRAAIARRLRISRFVVQEFGSAEAFLLERRPRDPGCAIVDLHMPGVDGLALQLRLLANGDPLPLIFLTGAADVRASVSAMKHGATDFLTKPVTGEDLLAATRAALERDAQRRRASQFAEMALARWNALTRRQREVCTLVVSGFLNKQIAAELGMVERTVKAHRAEVMRRMGVSSVAELVRMVGSIDQIALRKVERRQSRVGAQVRDLRR
jgi:FixJ family two-component response regulator